MYLEYVFSQLRAAQEGHWIGPSAEATLTQPPVVPPVVQQVRLLGMLKNPLLLPCQLQPPQIVPAPAPAPAQEWVQIPQRVYDLGRRQWNYRDSEPISFSVNGFPGINMHDALRRHFADLDNRDELMFQDAAGAISCRFLV